jgi:3-oxoadipate enol-lactonase
MPEFKAEDGCTLHYKTRGFERDGDVVVFLNGMTQSTMHWNSQAKAFAEEGFRVLTYDARGQGDSELGARDLTLELHASDLAGLLGELGVEKAHLVGFSHGSRIALAMANWQPERVEKLVLCSATARPTALARTIVRSWHGVLKSGGLEAMSWSSLPTILGNDFLEANEKILKGIVRAAVQRNSPEGVLALLEAMMDYPDLAELAANVSAPALVVSADQDLLVTRDGARELADLAGGAHREIAGVGHTIPIEAPEAFRETVVWFLRDE